MVAAHTVCTSQPAEKKGDNYLQVKHVQCICICEWRGDVGEVHCVSGERKGVGVEEASGEREGRASIPGMAA